MKLLAEHVGEHLGLPKVQTKTDDAERARQSDHAELIDEVGVAFVVLMAVVMRVAVRMFGGMRMFMMLMQLIGHRCCRSRMPLAA